MIIIYILFGITGNYTLAMMYNSLESSLKFTIADL
jgi:hypothetical protein